MGLQKERFCLHTNIFYECFKNKRHINHYRFRYYDNKRYQKTSMGKTTIFLTGTTIVKRER